jgi:ATP-dependent helicase HrpB
MVIFDEFHERNIHADVSLALTLETLSILRPDLKVLIMSATLGESLPPQYLQSAWRYEFDGTTFPVSTVYEPGELRSPIWERAATAIKSALRRYEGDILTFLPGAFEIQRTQELLERSGADTVITPLFGDLPYNEQSRAIHPDPQGRRKVVLATTIAETSITIEGVRVVIDTGLHKVSRTDASGNTSLSTEAISRDAAEQRAGRAGRTAPGVCVRLWTEQEHLARRPFRESELKQRPSAESSTTTTACSTTYRPTSSCRRATPPARARAATRFTSTPAASRRLQPATRAPRLARSPQAPLWRAGAVF